MEQAQAVAPGQGGRIGNRARATTPPSVAKILTLDVLSKHVAAQIRDHAVALRPCRVSV